VCVLLHGIALDRRDLEPLAGPLGRRHTVVSVDLRAHGESPAGTGLEIEDLAADVCALADELGLTGAVLIGHSLGGNVAVAAAARAPERFGGLVILDSTPVATPEALGWLQGLVASVEGPEYATAWPEFCRTALFGWTADERVRTAVSSRMGTAPRELTLPIIRSFTEYAAHGGRRDLAACDVPVLMISSSSPTNDEQAIRDAAPLPRQSSLRSSRRVISCTTRCRTRSTRWWNTSSPPACPDRNSPDPRRDAQVLRTVQALTPGAPYTWVKPTFGSPSTCRAPASPRSCVTTS
jgi:pimeloyl-ACP methyl ester carboxylesterase